ncbi:3-oxoacyl-[acyl-carrier-protein] synthase-3 [Ureibacillus xyleni]|uniref:3-oxoacyl-[acyl-carrier-protein] synthase-3 n=1 Tax=Ureibacillus xyleni TaxID=614648 RepID=A0A285RYK8_9BACL|nr:beta-ketoacyl-ACP synthase III [Ureibacillus xyleni]SOB99299.1 3-oxoacyl-[acyl-carrier-protein] synthase-3 [Ureibacillus xyleni]
MSQLRNVKILGTGKFLPKKKVTSYELDHLLGLNNGWVEQKSGVSLRSFVENETASEMAALASIDAINASNLHKEDIDCIVSVSGTMEQPIPCNASLVQKQLGLNNSKIPCFDINSTCLSFVTGFDTISYLVHSGRYKNVLLVSSEIASVGLNWKNKENAILFGDGAAAAVISKTPDTENSKILAGHMETFSDGAHFTEIRGGGTKLHPNHPTANETDFLFDMNGKSVFKLSSKNIVSYMEKLLSLSNCTINDIDLVVPHQASGMAMRILRNKLGIDEAKFMNIIHNHGNTIASSIPMALHEAIVQNKIQRGNKVMLIGTSAGLSIGGVVFEY